MFTYLLYKPQDQHEKHAHRCEIIFTYWLKYAIKMNLTDRNDIVDWTRDATNCLHPNIRKGLVNNCHFLIETSGFHWEKESGKIRYSIVKYERLHSISIHRLKVRLLL